MKNVIHFYSLRNKYGEFSNFARFPIEIGGVSFPTSEHYFQAMKYENNPERFNAIRLADTPSAAALMGRDRNYPLRKDWESVKDEVMLTALRAKFSQHSKLREILLSTGDDKLVEHTEKDFYWGDGGDGTGRNMLGTLLMKVREEQM